MTIWSAADPATGHLKVGINVTTSDSTPTYGESITITVNYYVETVGWTYNDNVTLHWQAFGASGTFNFAMNLGSGQSMKILTKTHTYTAGTSSIPVDAGCSISGAYDGADPSLADVTRYTIPATSGAPNTPAAPTNNGTNTPTTLPIKWTAPGTNGSAITGYNVRYRIGSGSWSTVTLGTGLSTTLTGLTPATAYTVQVQARSAAGNSAYSASYTASTTTSAPGAPTSAAIDDASTPTTSQVGVSWAAGAPNGATSIAYDVYVLDSNTAPSTGTTPTVSGLTTLSTTQAVFGSAGSTSPIAAGTAYWGWVRNTWATPGGSPGAWIAAGTATTQPSGAQGDLVDRLTVAMTQIGSDTANPTCVVAATSAQSVGTSATTLSWGSASPNTGTTPMYSGGSPTHVTIEKDGTYTLSGKMTLDSHTWSTGDYAEAKIQINGTSFEFNAVYPPGAALGSLPVAVPAKSVALSAGDVVTMVGLNTSGSVAIVTGAAYTSMTVTRTGP